MFFFISCESQILGLNKSQTVTPIDSTPVLIVFSGESNSGGIADNSYATEGELAKRKLKILNNTTKASFDSLDIGNNNLTGHLGLIYAASNAHGWELQIANKYDSSYFGSRQVFICKAGQGGTTISQWASSYTAEGYTYYPLDTFLLRVNSAIELISEQTGQTPVTVMFWSQGINDNSGDVSAWKTATKNLFTEIRDSLNITLPIVMTQFQSITAVTLTSFDTAITEITTEMSDVYAVNTTGAEVTEVYAGAGSHWGYTGMKVVANLMIGVLINNIL
jgi:hypothetical protein